MTKAAATNAAPTADTTAPGLTYAEQSLEDLLSVVDGRAGGAEFAAEVRDDWATHSTGEQSAELHGKVVAWLEADDVLQLADGEEPGEFPEPVCVHGYTRALRCPDGCIV